MKKKDFEQKQWFWPLTPVFWCGLHKIYWSPSHVNGCPYCPSLSPHPKKEEENG